ncbi:MAG: hypothetical protein R3F07_14050 [Opitutaceae bacterium]
MYPDGRLTFFLLTWALPLLADPPSTDSPILDLRDVIGIEVQRSSVGERAVGEGQTGRLVRDRNRGPEFRIVQTFDPASVRYRSIQIRTARGTWSGAMTVVPKGIKSPPGIFILDEGCAQLQFPGNRPDNVSVDDFDGPVYSRMPLSSHLIGMGFAVALPNPKSITDSDRSRSPADWIALIRQFQKKAVIDPHSLFLVATGANAELAMNLAAGMDFAGVVLEAPGEMMFVEEAGSRKRGPEGRQEEGAASSTAKPESPGDAWDGSYFQSEAHMVRYVEYARSIKAPVLVIMAKGTPGYDITRKTLLASFSAVSADISVALLPESATVPPPVKNRDQDRGVLRYDKVQLEQWINRMEAFLITHTRTKPHPLPLRDPTLQGPDLSRSAVLDEMKGMGEPSFEFPAESEVP